MSRIDLHIHTNASDGTYSGAQVVQLAHSQGLSAIAITDHDTVSGYFEAATEGEKLGVEVVPGIEISTKYDRAVHILGYYIDPKSPSLEPVLNWIVHDRDERNRKMAELMAADGLPVSYEMMHEKYGEVIGRPHFAALLVELGLAKSIQDAFDRFVEKGQKYYQPRTILPLDEAVRIIVDAGGIPVLAHPFQYRMDDALLRELIEYCMGFGLEGMECRYTGYDEKMVAYLEGLSAEYGLIRTGGSDFHGSNKPHISLGRGLGKLSVPDEYLTELKTKRR